MKKSNLWILSALLVSTLSFSQKDELKTLKKLYDKETPSNKDVEEYKVAVQKLMPLATEEGDKVYANFYKASVPFIEFSAAGPAAATNPALMAKIFKVENIEQIAAAYEETLAFEKKSGKKVFTDDIKEGIAVMKPMIIDAAIKLAEAKQHIPSARLLKATYQLDKTDPEKLYYAAGSYLNGEDYDNALACYNELKKLNYSGEGTLYYANNATTNKEELFPSKELRDIAVKTKSHNKIRDERIPSKRGEIYKNISWILTYKGRIEEAKQAIVDARRTNPDDTSLIISEANLYLQTNDLVTYKKLVEEALLKMPNDADLYYNLAVISQKTDKKESERMYLKALEINPNYLNANINLAILYMEGDEKIVNEMNNLGTSEKDNKRYNELKKERAQIFTKLLPYIEKAFELDPKNKDVSKTLQNVYLALERPDKVKEVKNKTVE